MLRHWRFAQIKTRDCVRQYQGTETWRVLFIASYLMLLLISRWVEYKPGFVWHRMSEWSLADIVNLQPQTTLYIRDNP